MHSRIVSFGSPAIQWGHPSTSPDAVASSRQRQKRVGSAASISEAYAPAHLMGTSLESGSLYHPHSSANRGAFVWRLISSSFPNLSTAVAGPLDGPSAYVIVTRKASQMKPWPMGSISKLLTVAPKVLERNADVTSFGRHGISSACLSVADLKMVVSSVSSASAFVMSVAKVRVS